MFFQSWAARLSSASRPWEAYALLYPLLASEAFSTFRTSMQFALDSADDTAGLSVVQVLPQLGEAVKAAVESVAAGAAPDMLYMERYLNHQADAVAEAGMEHLDQTVAEVKAPCARQTSELLSVITWLVQKVDASSACRAGGFTTRASGALIYAEHFTRVTIAAPPPATRATAVDRLISSKEVRASEVLLRDGANFRTVRVQQNLRRVDVHDGKGECVPLLKLQVGLSWERALDEYSVGIDGVVSVKEVEALFGSRWRLLCRDPDERNRHVHLYSTHAPLYRTFSVEFARRGAAAGVAHVLSETKTKYKGVRSSNAVYNHAK